MFKDQVLDAVVQRVAGDIAADSGRATKSVLREWLNDHDSLRRYQHLIRMTYRDAINPTRTNKLFRRPK